MAVSAEQYARQLRALLPTGPAWDEQDKETVMTRLLEAVADELARIDARSDDLLREWNPSTTLELLPDWERVMGLPDECVGVAQTVPERRDAIIAKLTLIGGQSRQFFIDLAAALGYTITITEFQEFQAGFSCAGDPCCGEAWAYAWQVNGPEVTVRVFLCGQNSSGDRLRTWGNEKLECAITQRKPAHTHVLFAYGDQDDDDEED